MKNFAAVTMLALAAPAHAGEVKLAWNANPETNITDYRVWRGIDCLVTVAVNKATVTLPDDACVLTVTARNAAGESGHSEPLELIAVTVEESPDLKSWTECRTIHREKKTAAFYRLKLQTGGAP